MGPIHGNAIPHGAAEQFVSRHTKRFRLDIETSVDQRRAGMRLQPARCRSRLCVKQGVNGVERARILADKRSTKSADKSGQSFTAARLVIFGPTDEAFVRRQLDKGKAFPASVDLER